MKEENISNEACADIMYQLLGSTIVCTLDDGRVAVGRGGVARRRRVDVDQRGVGVIDARVARIAAKCVRGLRVRIDLLAEVEGGEGDVCAVRGRLEEGHVAVERGQVVPLVVVPVPAGHRRGLQLFDF